MGSTDTWIAPDSAATVSVVVPTYNVERYIAQTLDAVVAQTLPGVEVIVVDDGSSDGTRRIVESYGPRVRLIAQENRGVCAARNRGAREARGRYLCFLDHDDYWYPDKLARQVAELDAHDDVGVVFSEFVRWEPAADGAFADPASVDLSAWDDGIDPAYSGWIYHQLLLDSWVLTSTAMLRASVIDVCGGFDENLPYSEDWDLWLRVSRHFRFTKLRRPTTLYRQHPTQGSRTPRSVDYRTRLLTQAYAKWGLASPDGSAIERSAFRRQLARYHLAFGFTRLQQDELLAAQRSFLNAWRLDPVNPKPLAFMLLSNIGWRPRW